jgi:hypothetical protein
MVSGGGGGGGDDGGGGGVRPGERYNREACVL